MHEGARFSRGLSDQLLEELKQGRFSMLLRALAGRGLDVQLRERYIDVYARGCRVLMLVERRFREGRYRASIHRKYLDGLVLPDARSGSERDQYVHFCASPDFVEGYVASLDTILWNSEGYVKPEAELEEHMIWQSHCRSSPVLFIDRQVQVHRIRRRADLIGVTTCSADRARVVLVELKQGLDTRIQHLMGQMGQYREVIAPDGRLDHEVAAAYRRVVAQKQELGLLPPAAVFPDEDPSVECLLVLADYNPKSELLTRLRHRARDASYGARLVLLEKGTHILPPAAQWEEL